MTPIPSSGGRSSALVPVLLPLLLLAIGGCGDADGPAALQGSYTAGSANGDPIPATVYDYDGAVVVRRELAAAALTLGPRDSATLVLQERNVDENGQIRVATTDTLAARYDVSNGIILLSPNHSPTIQRAELVVNGHGTLTLHVTRPVPNVAGYVLYRYSALLSR